MKIAQWAKELGIHSATLSSRLRVMSPTEALTHDNLNERLITYEGKTQNQKQWGKELGVHRQTVAHMVAQGKLASCPICAAWAQVGGKSIACPICHPEVVGDAIPMEAFADIWHEHNGALIVADGLSQRKIGSL